MVTLEGLFHAIESGGGPVPAIKLLSHQIFHSSCGGLEPLVPSKWKGILDSGTPKAIMECPFLLLTQSYRVKLCAKSGGLAPIFFPNL